MKRAFLLTTFLVAASGPALAQDTTYQVYGPGNITCATYTNDRTIRINADGWILGYWTGSNHMAEFKKVGISTDARGIVSEVAQYCRERPSMKLYDAELHVYERLKSESR